MNSNLKPIAGLLAALGVALLAVGLFLGVSSVHRAGVTCGSAFGGTTNNAEVRDLTNAMEGFGGSGLAAENACSSALSDRSTITYATLIPGAVVLLAAGAIAATRRPRVAA